MSQQSGSGDQLGSRSQPDPYAAGQPAPPGQSTPPAQGYQDGSSNYPSAPGYPSAPAYAQGAGGYGQSQGVPAQPAPIRTAVKLMYAGAVVTVISGVLQVVTGATMAQLTGSGMSDTQTETFAGVLNGATIVFSLLFAGLWVLNAVFNGKGAKWARILSTVLGGLAILSGVFSLAGLLVGLTAGGPTASSVLSTIGSLVIAGIAAAVLVLIWKPASSAFYQQVAAPTWRG